MCRQDRNAMRRQDLPGISRTHSYCGMRGEAEFAKCDVLVSCFNDNDNLYDWAVCLETQVRFRLHYCLSEGVFTGGLPAV